MVLSLKCKIDVSYFQLLLCLRSNSVYLGYPMLFSSLIHIKVWVQWNGSKIWITQDWERHNLPSWSVLLLDLVRLYKFPHSSASMLIDVIKRIVSRRARKNFMWQDMLHVAYHLNGKSGLFSFSDIFSTASTLMW